MAGRSSRRPKTWHITHACQSWRPPTLTRTTDVQRELALKPEISSSSTGRARHDDSKLATRQQPHAAQHLRPALGAGVEIEDRFQTGSRNMAAAVVAASAQQVFCLAVKKIST